MVDRPDWSTPSVPAVVEKPAASLIAFDGPGFLAEVEQRNNALVVGKPMPNAPGIGEALAREMTNTVEGLAANVESAAYSAREMESALSHEFGIESDALNAELAKLPEAMRDKIGRMVWRNPGVAPMRLIERLQRQAFTLEEQQLAKQAWYRLTR